MNQYWKWKWAIALKVCEQETVHFHVFPQLFLFILLIPFDFLPFHLFSVLLRLHNSIIRIIYGKMRMKLIRVRIFLEWIHSMPAFNISWIFAQHTKQFHLNSMNLPEQKSINLLISS